MWNYQAVETLVRQIQEQKLRKAKPLWELGRTREVAPSRTPASTWTNLKTLFQPRAKLQQKINEDLRRIS